MTTNLSPSPQAISQRLGPHVIGGQEKELRKEKGQGAVSIYALLFGGNAAGLQSLGPLMGGP